MNILAPSILSADFTKLGEQISYLEEKNVSHVHIDVMDGLFVPSISFGMPVIKSIRKSTNMIFDTHLMIEEPIRYIDEFVDCGSDIITVHAEACKHLDRTVNKIKERGRQCGVALSPATSLSVLDCILPYVDLVLVMSVNPGFGGQKLIPYTLGKIEELNWIRNENGFNYNIEVDGGINEETLPQVLKAGADMIVMGSAVFNGDFHGNVDKYMAMMND